MKKVYSIEVDCANCASKMENAINKIDGVTKATVNFMTQKLTLEVEDSKDINEILDLTVAACKKVDSDCEIRR